MSRSPPQPAYRMGDYNAEMYSQRDATTTLRQNVSLTLCGECHVAIPSELDDHFWHSASDRNRLDGPSGFEYPTL